MKVKTVKIYDGKLRLIGEDQEFYLMDGVYRREDGETITVRGHQIVDVIAVPNLKVATKEQLEIFLKDMEQQLQTVGDDAQMANIDL